MPTGLQRRPQGDERTATPSGHIDFCRAVSTRLGRQGALGSCPSRCLVCVSGCLCTEPVGLAGNRVHVRCWMSGPSTNRTPRNLVDELARPVYLIFSLTFPRTFINMRPPRASWRSRPVRSLSYFHLLRCKVRDI